MKSFHGRVLYKYNYIHIGTAVQKSKDACCQPTALSMTWIQQYYVLHLCKRLGICEWCNT